MSDVFSLKNHEHDVSVLITTVGEDHIPEITVMDRRTGQQVSMSVDVYFMLSEAIDKALEDAEIPLIEPDDDLEPELPFNLSKLN